MNTILSKLCPPTDRLTQWLTGVKRRETDVAKKLNNIHNVKQMETEVEIDVGQENFSTSKVKPFYLFFSGQKTNKDKTVHRLRWKPAQLSWQAWPAWSRMFPAFRYLTCHFFLTQSVSWNVKSIIKGRRVSSGVTKCHQMSQIQARCRMWPASRYVRCHQLAQINIMYQKFHQTMQCVIKWHKMSWSFSKCNKASRSVIARQCRKRCLTTAKITRTYKTVAARWNPHCHCHYHHHCCCLHCDHHHSWTSPIQQLTRVSRCGVRTNLTTWEGQPSLTTWTASNTCIPEHLKSTEHLVVTWIPAKVRWAPEVSHELQVAGQGLGFLSEI